MYRFMTGVLVGAFIPFVIWAYEPATPIDFRGMTNQRVIRVGVLKKDSEWLYGMEEKYPYIYFGFKTKEEMDGWIKYIKKDKD